MRIAFLLFLFFNFQIVFGQKSLLLNFNLDGGVPMNTYGNNRNMLSSKATSFNTQGGISLTARFWDRIGLDFGWGQNFQYLNLKDKAFQSRYPGYVMKMHNSNFYNSFYANIQFLQKLSDNTFLYGQAGYSLNLIGARQISASKVFVIGNETITATSVYNNQNNSITGELGIQKFINDKHMFSFGLKLNAGKQPMMNGTYTSVDGSGNRYSDTYNSKGSYLGVVFKYGFVLAHSDKKEKKIKHLRPEDMIVTHPDKPKPDSVIHKPTGDTTTHKPKADTIKPPKSVEGRAVNVTHKVGVTNKTVTVKVWDHEQIDGDRISINLNGRWVLINYSLQKEQKVFQVTLNDGANFFVLHALNLGKYPPNTAAIIIDDGVKENKIILESTLETSGTIEITVNPK